MQQVSLQHSKLAAVAVGWTFQRHFTRPAPSWLCLVSVQVFYPSGRSAAGMLERLQLWSCSPSAGTTPAPPRLKCSLTRAQVTIRLVWPLPSPPLCFYIFPMTSCRCGRDAHAESTCEQPQLGLPHRALHLHREAGDGQKLQGSRHHLGTATSLFNQIVPEQCARLLSVCDSCLLTPPAPHPLTTQAQPRVFSAGLDIMEMYRKSPERCGEFWRAVQEMWLKLYSSNMVTIAAINVCLSFHVFLQSKQHLVGQTWRSYTS